MSVTRVGSIQSYIYNARTGKLSSKDGTADEFISFFNGDLARESTETLNGYDLLKRGGIETLIELGLGQLGSDNVWIDPTVDEYEITCEIVSGEESVYSVNGKSILTQYVPVFYTKEDLKTLGTRDDPFQTRQSKAYDAASNSMNLAVGDIFDLRNGYRLVVKDNYVHVERNGAADRQDADKVQQLADGLTDLIRFADQQYIAEAIWRGYIPMLLSFLRELGIDTGRDFTINKTTCTIKDGRIQEAGNTSVLPSSVYKAALKRDEEELYRPLSKRAAS